MDIIFNYLVDSFADVIQFFLTHQITYAPILLLILEEAGIPLPIPGDIIIAYTGYKISTGAIPYIGAFITILISVLIGASILYFLSAKFGQEIVLKFGQLIHLNDKKLLTVEHKFKKYGPWVIIFGRHIPGFRIPITVFAGISKIPYKTFILSTFISIIFWIPFYLGVGQKLGIKTVHLLKGHHWYFLIVFLPFLLFVIGLILSHLKKPKTKV
jgi:membrane protein DedA with SNARE-associated domain